jgi:hypothetical protein
MKLSKKEVVMRAAVDRALKLFSESEIHRKVITDEAQRILEITTELLGTTWPELPREDKIEKAANATVQTLVRLASTYMALGAVDGLKPLR